MFSIKQQNISKYYVFRPEFALLLLILHCFSTQNIFSQQISNDTTRAQDSLRIVSDSAIISDSNFIAKDSIFADTSALSKSGKKPLLEAEVKYSSEDSLIFSIGDQKVFLFDKAVVNYEDIGLT